MADVAIRVKGVSKRYEVFENQRSRLMHAFWPQYRQGMQEVWALRDVDFEVARGESVGVIGRNGGGKSTLLQILTGVLAPTHGDVQVNGRVSALLELGSGFNPEYTGRDNVVLNGLLLGLSRDEILARFDEIAAFAEIGEAMDRPVKTYSSGMLMRLAFAVQVLTDPDILIVDEALSVGDFFFQQKCFARLRAMRERGLTLIFVSHDMATVRDLCARAVYLRQGAVRFDGRSTVAIARYLEERPDDRNASRVEPAAPEGELATVPDLHEILRDAAWSRPDDPGDGGPRLIAVAFYDADGNASMSHRLGQTMRMKVAYQPGDGAPTHVAVVLRNRFDQLVTSLGSSRLGLAPPPCRPGEAVVFEMALRLMVEAGGYSVIVSLSHVTAANRGECVDTTPALGPVHVAWDYESQDAPFLGMVGLPVEGTFKVAESAVEERA
jgi:lipopolysaccharide transport system ATP-binding protein